MWGYRYATTQPYNNTLAYTDMLNITLWCLTMVYRYDTIHIKGGYNMNELKRDVIQSIIESTKHLNEGFTIQEVKEVMPELSECVIKKYLHRGANNGMFSRMNNSIGGRGNQTRYQVNTQEPEYINKKEVLHLFNDINKLLNDFIGKKS